MVAIIVRFHTRFALATELRATCDLRTMIVSSSTVIIGTDPTSDVGLALRFELGLRA